MKCVPHPLVMIAWVDTSTLAGWRQLSEFEGKIIPLACRSVGYLVKRTKEVVLIASHVAEGDDIGISDPFVIPVCVIKGITVLKKANA